MSEETGLKLLGQHLAKVKLEAEEMRYRHKTEVVELNSQVTELQKQLDVCRSDIEEYKKQVKALEIQGTRKALFDEREQWKKLVESLRKDKKRLQQEREELKEALKNQSQSQVANISIDTNKDGNNNSDIKSNENSESENDYKKRARTISGNMNGGFDEAERIKFHSEINILQSELEQKNVEVEALKEKLDHELELKWERVQSMDSSWRKSLLDSFKEVLSPLPQSLRSEKEILIPAEDNDM
mmetsp:Transcript_1025/g.1496  ORF Transcript_1025/g.1496 Transcript_1025/m.1496 type:complete len:242 (+) Transcript_1025:196-921(+)